MGKAKNLDLSNIKNAKTGGYQIQFYVDGKSYSGFSMDLSEAIKIRDKMREKLKIVPNGAFKRKSQQTKKSLIPGTRHIMAAGITFTTFMSRGYKTHYILVNWRDAKGKQKTKSYYCGKESTYSVKKGKKIYDLALKFRKAYEKAVLDGTLHELDPSKYSITSKTIESNTPLKERKQKAIYRLSRNKRSRRLSKN